eukprot:TRINITY_DN9011_c0_g1_i4.p1 TRINITY_DN9011_c0_g1~~TRINITY_DN9011_c0_g1_i4.p1  ORF type:complete len:181 (-),score=15.67 TRINITY_DN9011_c0_g1_i4:479-1021(-)
MSDKLAPESKHKFIYNEKVVYEWDQTLQEINMYIQLPGEVKAKQLTCSIQSNKIDIGITGNPPYLEASTCFVFRIQLKVYRRRINGQFSQRVLPSESFWTIEDGTLHIQLTKAEQGVPWKEVIVGHGNLQSMLGVEEDRKRLMLERFQLENPGFDFSQAQFSGEVPDAHKFLGGPHVERK